MIVAIVPAAGQSLRMGKPKLLLPLGPRSIIEHVLVAISGSQVADTVVVVPPRAAELAAAVRACQAQVLQLKDPTLDMRSTIQHGLDYIQEHWASNLPDGFLVALADQPTITPETVNCLVDRFRASSKSIFIPTCNGRRGHPVLFAWRLAEQVRKIAPGRGLNDLVSRLGAEVEECPVDLRGVLGDIDTPEDYQNLLDAQFPPEGS